MEKLIINQSMHLNGEIEISGSKNAALPILCASLLVSDKLILDNVPNIKDVRSLIDILREMGVRINFKNGSTVCDASALHRISRLSDLAKSIRVSILLLGPLLARLGNAEIPIPGGCAIGSRPIDQHVKGLLAMGAEIQVQPDYIKAKAPFLHGALIVMDVGTVTGTENLIMAAVLANGTTVIDNASREPEVVDLCTCLVKMGANINGIGTNMLTINGVEKLHGARHSIIPDRMETSTFAIAAVITQGDLMLTNVRHVTMGAVMKKLRKAGACIYEDENFIRVQMNQRPEPVDIITLPHPGFPTDMQAPMMVLNCIANGMSVMTETIYENRFQHVTELQRMGAKLNVFGNTVKVYGVKNLKEAKVVATDLRSCAALVLAGLCAEGKTVVDNCEHIDRGYECIERKLNSVGANIFRVKY